MPSNSAAVVKSSGRTRRKPKMFAGVFVPFRSMSARVTWRSPRMVIRTSARSWPVLFTHPAIVFFLR
ncbi:hypothetical protein ACFQY5_41170 [Paeniroseomonas aquatica]|uniref:hypothetical protein n=1 Tax=Paeniroseomonas aquatica TaxID=373043 RepID=UPI003608DF91